MRSLCIVMVVLFSAAIVSADEQKNNKLQKGNEVTEKQLRYEQKMLKACQEDRAATERMQARENKSNFEETEKDTVDLKKNKVTEKEDEKIKAKPGTEE